MIEFVSYTTSSIVCFLASVLVARNYINEVPIVIEQNAGVVSVVTFVFLVVVLFYKQWQRDVHYLCANINQNQHQNPNQ